MHIDKINITLRHIFNHIKYSFKKNQYNFKYINWSIFWTAENNER